MEVIYCRPQAGFDANPNRNKNMSGGYRVSASNFYSTSALVKNDCNNVIKNYNSVLFIESIGGKEAFAAAVIIAAVALITIGNARAAKNEQPSKT